MRVLTLIESQVRRGLADEAQELDGLYAGQPTRTTAQPTARRLLAAFERAHLTLSRVTLGATTHWHVTPLSDRLIQILRYLGLSPRLYADLALRPP